MKLLLLYYGSIRTHTLCTKGCVEEGPVERTETCISHFVFRVHFLCLGSVHPVLREARHRVPAPREELRAPRHPGGGTQGGDGEGGQGRGDVLLATARYTRQTHTHSLSISLSLTHAHTYLLTLFLSLSLPRSHIH